MTDLYNAEETEFEKLQREIEEVFFNAVNELDRITAEFFKEMKEIK